MTIFSNIYGVPDRAYSNAFKARLRDPTRPLRMLDFFTYQERLSLYYDVFGADGFVEWLDDLYDEEYRYEEYLSERL